mmetsp:Transcript_23814/g.49832  ORF Transcript_23814/g.49832 Transcript_23814/m.49832 type:complete len:343 (+) Transcript_23814:111-1139(+)
MLSITPVNVHSTDVLNTSICTKEDPIILFDPVQVSSGNITPEPSIEFSNYDVLLMQSCEDTPGPVSFAPGNHVGNQRFRVLLSLYRQRYLQAEIHLDNEECSRIAREVMATVYQKCVPNGRVYEKDRNNQWQELELGPSTLAIIQKCLANEPTDSLHSEERSPKQVCCNNRRYSAFGSVVSTDSEEGSSVPVPNRFDVICDAEEMTLKQGCKHTGNNRVKVLLDLHRKSYKQSKNTAAKRTIAQEIVSSIMDDASSQFLRLDELSGMYNPMSRESALACIKNSLDTATEGEKRQFRESEVKKLMDRRKKKAVLGRFERGRNGFECNLPDSSTTPTRFTTAFR